MTASTTSPVPQQQQRGAASLCICAAGICCAYLYYGILQERYFSGSSASPLGANFALVSQTATNAMVALIWSRIEQTAIFKMTMTSYEAFRKDASMNSSTSSGGDVAVANASRNTSKREDNESTTTKSSLNHPLLLLTAFWYITAMSTSNYSFRYVSYPTAVLAKSCKLIPTMLVSIVLEGKRYSLQEWFSAACISSGIVIFHLSRHIASATTTPTKNDSMHGIVLLVLSLLMDGFLGSCQGLLKRPSLKGNPPLQTGAVQQESQSQSQEQEQRPPTAMETMFYVNLYALVFLFPMTLYSGEWDSGIRNIQNKNVFQGLLLLNATAATGQVFIFLTLTWFSPLVCTTITTTRKFFTILLSVWTFGHVFSWIQWCAIGLVFTGLYTGIVSKVLFVQKTITEKEITNNVSGGSKYHLSKSKEE